MSELGLDLLSAMIGFYREELKKTKHFLDMLMDENGNPRGDTTHLEEKVKIYEKLLEELEILMEMEG